MVWQGEARLNAKETPCLASKLEALPAYHTIRHLWPRPPSLPPERMKQEAHVFQDVVRLLSGAEGTYIRYAAEYDPANLQCRLAGPDFTWHRGLDPALRDAVTGVVNMAKHFVALQAVAEVLSTASLGRVNHAFGASLRGLVADLSELVAGIDIEAHRNVGLSLSDTFLLLQSSKARLEQAHATVQHVYASALDPDTQIRDAGLEDGIQVMDSSQMSLGTPDTAATSRRFIRGGAVLQALCQRLEHYGGNPVARDLLNELIHRCSEPYLDMLRSWIVDGVVDDPYREFMIKETHTVDSADIHTDYADAYWEKRYTLCSLSHLPLQLCVREIANEVLLAGKYLNVLRECGEPREVSEVATQWSGVTSILDSSLPLVISEAYKCANVKLLRFLLHSRDLEDYLTALRRVFLGDDSDFLPIFLELAKIELEKPAVDASATKLQYALDLAVAQPGSVSSQQAYLDKLNVSLASTSLISELLNIANVSGVTKEQWAEIGNDILALKRPEPSRDGSLTADDALLLDLRVPFPLSLVVTSSCLYRYQFLFRHLLSLKQVERVLENAWLVQTKSVVWRYASSNTDIRRWRCRAQELRARMNALFQQMLYYCVVNVIDANWNAFSKTIPEIKTVSGLRHHHLSFLDKCMQQCLLTAPALLTSLAKLFRTARLYGHFLQSHDATLAWVDSSMLTKDEFNDLRPIRGPDGAQYTTAELLSFLKSALNQYEVSFEKYLKGFLAQLAVSAQYESVMVRTLAARLECI